MLTKGINFFNFKKKKTNNNIKKKLSIILMFEKYDGTLQIQYLKY